MIDNILLVYEEELFADGLVHLIHEIKPEANVKKCIIYDDVEKYLMQEKFDMVLVCKHKTMEVTYACPIIKKYNPDCRIIFVSCIFTTDDIKKYIENSVNGIICKKYSTAKVKSILSLLLMGDNYYPSELLPHTNKEFLSKQQLNIVKFLRNGYSNKQIAYELKITEATVKAHMSIIMRKFNVVNRIQVIQKALEKGILEY